MKAGGRIHGEPAIRDTESGYYSAAVLDFDNNSIEVRHREGAKVEPQRLIAGDVANQSVLSWQKDVAKSIASNSALAKSTSPQVIINNVTAPTMVISQPIPDSKPKSDMSTKAFIGTLLGAAAGAAVAYAMTKAEDESDRATVPKKITYQTIESVTVQPTPSAASPESCGRSMAPSTQRPTVQQIEYPHHPPSIAVRSSSHGHRPFIEDHPATQVATAPAHQGTLIDTFIPPSEVARYHPRLITRSHTDSVIEPSRSYARSTTTSRPAQPSRASSAARTITPANYPLSPGSVVTEVRLARDMPLPNSRATSVARDEREGYSPSMLGSVTPSDSVSQAGSKKSTGSRRSKRHSSATGKSRRSNAGDSHASGETVREEKSKEETKKGSVVSMPIRPGSKVSIQKSVKSFISGL